MSCVIGFYRSQSQHITAQASQAFAKVQHVRLCCSSKAFVAKAGIACELRCPYIVRHRTSLCVLLTNVQKPGFRVVCDITDNYIFYEEAGQVYQKAKTYLASEIGTCMLYVFDFVMAIVV